MKTVEVESNWNSKFTLDITQNEHFNFEYDKWGNIKKYSGIEKKTSFLINALMPPLSGLSSFLETKKIILNNYYIL